ncbi:MAG: hypothetical protein ABIE47_16420 [Pseudomonadota bacterium]|nr:hypothetical protein [Desulfobacterales bacterium]MBL7171387.1 hypothetical protein [Desulfobacteraceae bacterium]MBU0733403.1 hypothetical protein [Pseudomonadota bacterium]MBU0989877.1 hypothetical protein [Pseudomonadota bacterium]
MEDRFPILIAGDDPVSRTLLEKTLTKAGHEVVSVKDGREALAFFSKRFFPIVFDGQLRFVVSHFSSL